MLLITSQVVFFTIPQSIYLFVSVSVIGELEVAPMNDMVGFVVTPVNPSDAVTNESCPDNSNSTSYLNCTRSC